MRRITRNLLPLFSLIFMTFGVWAGTSPVLEKELVIFATQQMMAQDQGLKSLFRDEEKAIDRKYFMVENLIAAVHLSQLITEEKLLQVKHQHSTLSYLGGNEVTKKYSYVAGPTIEKSKKLLDIEEAQSRLYAGLKQVLPNFPLLLKVESLERITPKDLYFELKEIIEDHGLSMDKLSALRNQNQEKLADFFFILFEKSSEFEKQISEAFEHEVERTSDLIAEAVEELNENGVSLIIHNQQLIERFRMAQLLAEDKDVGSDEEFARAIEDLRIQYPLEENTALRMLLGSGLLITGLATSVTGFGLGMVGTGAVILAGSTLAILDGIETHKSYEKNQVNAGLYLTKLISDEDYLKHKKQLQMQMVFTAIDVATAPIDIFNLVQMGKVKFVAQLKKLDSISTAQSPELFFAYNKIDYKKYKVDGDVVYELLPSRSSHLNRYVIGAKKISPETKIFYIPGYLDEYVNGCYVPSKKWIVLGDGSINANKSPLYFNSTFPHELMHSRFYQNIRNGNFDYAMKIHSRFSKIEGAGGYSSYMSSQESHTFVRSAKSHMKELAHLLGQADPSVDRAHELISSIRSRSISGYNLADVAHSYYSDLLTKLDTITSESKAKAFISVSLSESKQMDDGYLVLNFNHKIKGTEIESYLKIKMAEDELITGEGAMKVVAQYKEYLKRQKELALSDVYYQEKIYRFADIASKNESIDDLRYYYNLMINAYEPNRAFAMSEKSNVYNLYMTTIKEGESAYREYGCIANFGKTLAQGTREKVVKNGQEIIRFVLDKNVVETTLDGKLLSVTLD